MIRPFPAIAAFATLTSLLFLPATDCTGQTTTTVVIDWTRSDRTVNRPIFSTQGFMQIYAEKDPMVMETFKLTNPTGTQTRLETYIHQMEPKNDNDDPRRMNWQVFQPQKMIRFIDDRTAFDRTLREFGMEPLSLLCYNVDWLDSGNESDPIRDKDEWAEFAAAVVETYNGRGAKYRPNLRYVEVWNEPNMKQFYTGSMESYFDLFKRTADRIHHDYPGVMVGGPALTHAPDCRPRQWMEAFIRECGARADYLTYHPYGESVDKMTEDIRHWTAEFRKIPGKEQGRVMLTETDQWTDGWPKIQYMLRRQFRFLDMSDMILGIHHFCCLAYRETGNYTFGIVDKQGTAIEGTFWPYWIFRGLTGNEAHTQRVGERQGDVDLAASFDRSDQGQWIGSAVLHNRSDSPLALRTALFFPPADSDRVLVFERIAQDRKGVESVLPIAAGTAGGETMVDLGPGEAVGLRLQESGRRFHAFGDILNQEGPWIEAVATPGKLGLGDGAELRVRVINTTLQPISGQLALEGLPSGWEHEQSPRDARIDQLASGETHECTFRFTANSVTAEGRAAPYAVLKPAAGVKGLPTQWHSIPVSLEFVNPLETMVLPVPVHAVRGETNGVTLQLSSQVSQPVAGQLKIELPEGIVAERTPSEFTMPAMSRRRFDCPFRVSADVKPGEYKGRITAQYLGTSISIEFTIAVGEGRPVANATPLDIAPLANIDAAAFSANRKDYARDKIGMFVYPADFTPSSCTLNIRGVPYRLASLEDGHKNAILPSGELIPVQAGPCAGVAFMGFGHDGKHHGTWTFHYADASSQKVESQIPEWCTPAPDGFEVAFNAPHRYVDGGPAGPACQLFTWTLKTDPTKTLTGIELPAMTKAYIFAITLIGAER